MKVFLNEKGMTFIELLFATFLLAFVLIALTTLMMGAVTASSFARKQTKAIAFANQKIEEVRGLGYASIGIEGSDPDGILKSSHLTSGNFEYWYTVEWVDDVEDNTPKTPGGSDSDRHDYKKVTVNVTWSGSPSQTIQVATYIKQKAAQNNVAPTVQFTSSSPATPSDGTVVRTDDDIGTADIPDSIPIGATASDSDGKIITLRFYFNGHTPDNPTALFHPNSGSANESYNWKTHETDPVTHERLYPDGAREVRAQVWDDAGATSYRAIYLVVDNSTPTWSDNTVTGEPSYDIATSTCAVTLSWIAPEDGTDKVTDYFVYRSTDGVNWTKTSIGDSSLTKNEAIYSYKYPGLNAWTNYQFQIEARSPWNAVNGSGGFLVPSTVDANNETLINLTESAITKNSCTLVRDPSSRSGITFDLYRDGTRVKQNMPSPYTDTGLTRETTYSYQVKALDAGGSVVNTSNTLTVTTPKN